MNCRRRRDGRRRDGERVASLVTRTDGRSSDDGRRCEGGCRRRRREGNRECRERGSQRERRGRRAPAGGSKQPKWHVVVVVVVKLDRRRRGLTSLRLSLRLHLFPTDNQHVPFQLKSSRAPPPSKRSDAHPPRTSVVIVLVLLRTAQLLEPTRRTGRHSLGDLGPRPLVRLRPLAIPYARSRSRSKPARAGRVDEQRLVRRGDPTSRDDAERLCRRGRSGVGRLRRVLGRRRDRHSEGVGEE